MPFALDVPGAKTLVARVVAREVTVLNKAVFEMSTWEMYLFVITHADGILLLQLLTN